MTTSTIERGIATHTPFLKWAGGKRALLPQILPLLPTIYRRYYEPFLGGGALLFALQPNAATVSDLNDDLVNSYVQVRDNVDAVIDRLMGLEIDQGRYYEMRRWQPVDPLDRAVRFLYLNRTAFNGLYRVNKVGQFNVPFGCKETTTLCDERLLRSASQALRYVQVQTEDFEQATLNVGGGDLVYFDPPYTVKHNNNGFRKYNQAIFSWADQERLALLARNLAARGAYVVISNAAHTDVEALYRGFRSVRLERPSLISGRASGRGRVEESLFLSW